MDNDLYKIFEGTYFNNKYYLKEFKGAGAFGAVFLADEVVGGTKIQEVAIKAIRKDKMPSDIIAKELVTAIRLKHPNLINCITSEEGRLKHSVFDYDCFGLVMEIASGTLEDYLQASRVLPAIEVREIVGAIASGLVYLHGQSVTHRDLKPANVLRVGNVWKISDFGIARQMGRESGTMTTSLTGTPIYMPPEVYAASSEASPMRVSPAWDIWSLGVMIVEMLTGTLPFDGVTDIWKMKINIKGDLPMPFDAIVQNCLRQDPKKRWNANQIFDNAVKNASAWVKDNQGVVCNHNQAIGLNPNQANDYFNSGLEKFELGDREGAIADYTAAIYLVPNDAEAYNNRGLAKSELGDKEGAIIDYTAAIYLNPNDAVAYFNRGLAKSDSEDKEGAIIDYTAAIHLNPNYADAYNNRGLVKYSLGDAKGAIADYSQAMCLDPNRDEALTFLRGLAKSELGDIQGAIADYDESIRLDPKDDDIYYLRGLAKSELGDPSGAIDDYDESIRLNSNNDYVYYKRSLAKSELGNKKGAIDDCTEAIRLNPNYAIAYYMRGYTKYIQGLKLKTIIDRVILDFTEAIRITPDFADAYYMRGLVKQLKMDKQEALTDFHEAASLYQKEGNTTQYESTLKLIRDIV